MGDACERDKAAKPGELSHGVKKSIRMRYGASAADGQRLNSEKTCIVEAQ